MLNASKHEARPKISSPNPLRRIRRAVEDYDFDRLEVEAQQCVKLTSTNRPFGLTGAGLLFFAPFWCDRTVLILIWRPHGQRGTVEKVLLTLAIPRIKVISYSPGPVNTHGEVLHDYQYCHQPRSQRFTRTMGEASQP